MESFVVLMKFLLILGVLLVSQEGKAQTGYNYARPELAIGGFPAATTAAAGFPATAAAYGVTAAGGSVSPTTGYAGFSTQAQRVPTAAAYSPTAGQAVPATAYGGTPPATAAQKRPTLQAQTRTGIYGSIGVGGGQPPQQYASNSAVRGGSGIDADYPGDYSAIPGVPGVDYPVYAQVPPTNFDCSQQPLPGYYSDVEAQCQVFHICALNRTYSFLCPNGTIFSQATLVCVWWNQYDCVSAPSLYANNAFIYDYSNQGGAPAAGGFQAGVTPVGIGGATRAAQSNFQTAANAARASGTPTANAIYGGGNLRPTVPAAFPSGTGNTGLGRYTPTAAGAAAAATFPTGPAAGTATPFGGATAIRSSAFPTGIQEAGYTAAQITPKTTNREYLPPPQKA